MVDFEWLQSRLVETLRNRVHRGEWTERGMARATGVSQPHLHNVLKGCRLFSLEMSDVIMRRLNISLSDLWMSHAGSGPPGVRLVPLLTPEIGPYCHQWPQDIGQYFALGETIFLEFRDLAAVRLAHDPEMFPAFCRGDIVLLDCSAAARGNPSPADAYVVETQNTFAVRYVRRGGRRLFLLTELTAGDPRQWDEVPLAGRHIRDVVKARVVWMCRYVDRAGPRR